MPRTRTARPAPAPLGSLTQPGTRASAPCPSCGSARTTSIAMTLTDGTPVSFTSCHSCEHRSWQEEGQHIDVAGVLERTRKR